MIRKVNPQRGSGSQTPSSPTGGQWGKDGPGRMLPQGWDGSGSLRPGPWVGCGDPRPQGALHGPPCLATLAAPESKSPDPHPPLRRKQQGSAVLGFAGAVETEWGFSRGVL